ncbi:carboxylesteras-like protein [Lophium mytilinum]|uniref:Carboxylesteras-like protein n=1 Tax=Lophium mytilinum TaxID=390894 RepID=A0A6A6RE72_9PEZI|nr:carboxylesteras-like protein [Lophium mytilinum]
MEILLSHRDIGTIKGIRSAGVAQFLGVKYAALADRLAPPTLVTSYAADPIDATTYGPSAVSPPMGCDMEFGIIQHSLPKPQQLPSSDLDCLNLNITVPLDSSGEIHTAGKLPVFVFIHGGGFGIGANWWPQYDAAELVRLSKAKGKPVIGININYRLGALGFLTSKELRQAGYPGNNGLRDQRAALQWIRKFIGVYGGSSDEITVVGESAGAFSATMLLQSKEPLMKRTAAFGGSPLLFKPLPLPVTEFAYESVLQALGLVDKSPESRIQALLEIPTDELWQKIPPAIPMMPFMDDDIVTAEPTFAMFYGPLDRTELAFPGLKWCEGLMVGDCQFDGNVFGHIGLHDRKTGIATAFIRSVEATLKSNSTATSAILEAYQIRTDTSDDDALNSILQFASDITFYAPAITIAAYWPSTRNSKSYLFHFNEPNPWDGLYKGKASHVLDVAYLFQNFAKHLTDDQKAVGRALGSDFIEFVNGGSPWQPVSAGKMCARVYGPSDAKETAKLVDSSDTVESGRNRKIHDLASLVGCDALAEVYIKFFQGT